MYEETTGTLLAGDLFTHVGNGPALVTSDVVGPAIDAELLFRYSTLAPGTTETLARLADLQPRTLALMHGSSFTGDGAGALRELAAQPRQPPCPALTPAAAPHMRRSSVEDPNPGRRRARDGRH